MQFTLKNEQMYFLAGIIWNRMDYKQKYQLNTQMTTEQGDSYEQEFELTLEILNAFYQNLPMSCTREFISDLILSIENQIEASDGNYQAYKDYLAAVAANNELPQEEQQEITPVELNEAGKFQQLVETKGIGEEFIQNNFINVGKVNILS